MAKLVKIIVECGSCNAEVEPTTICFETESDGTSCPGCDGSYGQMTCLCGGAKITKTLEFRCPECNCWETIYID